MARNWNVLFQCLAWNQPVLTNTYTLQSVVPVNVTSFVDSLAMQSISMSRQATLSRSLCRASQCRGKLRWNWLTSFFPYSSKLHTEQAVAASTILFQWLANWNVWFQMACLNHFACLQPKHESQITDGQLSYLPDSVSIDSVSIPVNPKQIPDFVLFWTKSSTDFEVTYLLDIKFIHCCFDFDQ